MLAGTYDSPGRASDVCVDGNYAFLADGEAGVEMLDISDLSHPQLINNYDTPGAASRICVDGDYIYVADRNSMDILKINSTGIDDPRRLPEAFWLLQNYPNPFNGQTMISYCLDKKSMVSLKVYSITGQLLRVMAQKELQKAGEHQYIWDGRNKDGGSVSTGVYFYELYVDNYRESRAMIMIK
jgi:hypothetical protein